MSFSSSHLFFDDLEVGQQWTSGGRTVTEADIVNFASFSGDFNPIHIDAEWTEYASVPKAISADQKYMISTARLCEWPISRSRWCRWPRSAAKGDWPFHVRRTIARTRSAIGIAMIVSGSTSGMKTGRAACVASRVEP